MKLLHFYVITNGLFICFILTFSQMYDGVLGKSGLMRPEEYKSKINSLLLRHNHLLLDGLNYKTCYLEYRIQ